MTDSVKSRQAQVRAARMNRDGKGQFDHTIFPKSDTASQSAVIADLKGEPKKSREEIVADLKDEVQKGVAAIDSGAEWQKMLDFFGDFHQYSLRNMFLIKLQNPQASCVASFKKLKEKGFQVRKGEKAIKILSPLIVDKIDKETKQPVIDPKTGKPAKQVIGFTYVSVFDISQTDEIPGVEHDISMVRTARAAMRPGEEPPGMRDALVDECKKHGFEIEYRDMNLYGTLGATSFADHKIYIPSNASPAGQMEILAHELGHVMLEHGSEENIKHYHTGEGGERDRMEVEAESVAYVLSRAWGVANPDQTTSFDYISGWSRKRPELVKEVFEKINKVSQKLPLPND
ncbi:MAG: ArdC-like ssDNA-binding domain-containing protein [Ferrimicrobium acidiphilum]